MIFERIQKDIIISSEDIDELIFDKSYYYSSKSEILSKYPTLENLLMNLKKIIDLSSIEDFINNQKLEHMAEIKEYKIIIKTLIFEVLINNKHFKDVYQLNSDNLTDFIDIDELKKKIYLKNQ